MLGAGPASVSRQYLYVKHKYTAALQCSSLGLPVPWQYLYVKHEQRPSPGSCQCLIYITLTTNTHIHTRCAQSKGPRLDPYLQVLVVAADLTDDEKLRTLVDKTMQHYGQLDVLVSAE